VDTQGAPPRAGAGPSGPPPRPSRRQLRSAAFRAPPEPRSGRHGRDIGRVGDAPPNKPQRRSIRRRRCRTGSGEPTASWGFRILPNAPPRALPAATFRTPA